MAKIELIHPHGVDVHEVTADEGVTLSGGPYPMTIMPTKEHRLFVLVIPGVEPSVLQVKRTLDGEEVERVLAAEKARLVKRQNRIILLSKN